MGEYPALQRTIKAYIHRGERYYVAECLGIGVVTQGVTLDETIDNLREAVALHLDGEDPSEFGLANDPTLLTPPLSLTHKDARCIQNYMKGFVERMKAQCRE